MRHAAFYSFLLHFIVFLLLFFGLPWFPQERPEIIPSIPVEVVTIAAETTTPKPTLTPVREAPEPEEKKPEPTPEPEKPTPPPSPNPEPAPEPEPSPLPEPVMPPKPLEAPKPEIKPELEAVPEPALKADSKEKEEKPKPEIKEPAPEPQPKPAPPKPVEKEKPKPVPKPKPKKKEKPKEQMPKKKKNEQSFDSILKNLEDMREKIEDDRELPTDPNAPAPARQVGKEDDDLTISERDLLQRHFRDCWYVQGSTRDAENLAVPVQLSINPDGTVKEAHLIDNQRFNTDPYYRSVAEAALRAAKDPRCAKLPLSPETLKKYDSINITFDPSFLLGG